MKTLPIILAALLTGSSLWLADRAVRDLPPRIDVDGRLLRMRVEGRGSPTVVLEIGLGGALEEWAAVQPKVALFTKVVAYDRLGAVDRSSGLTGEEVARELRAALRNAGIEPPYILVGQSFGGIYNRVFASLYPDEVAGMLLLDPSQEDFIRWMEKHQPDRCISKRDVVDWPEGAGIWATLDQLKQLPALPDVPVVVVTGTKPSDDPVHIQVLPVWTKSHADFVKTLPQGRHVLAPESGHGVHVEAAELVVQVIKQLVETAPRSEVTSHASTQILNVVP
jgi:pimeloyl-ACP methyl ester carboxylesterase